MTPEEFKAASPAAPQRGHLVHSARYGMMWHNGARWCLIIDVQAIPESGAKPGSSGDCT